MHIDNKTKGCIAASIKVTCSQEIIIIQNKLIEITTDIIQ